MTAITNNSDVLLTVFIGYVHPTNTKAEGPMVEFQNRFAEKHNIPEGKLVEGEECVEVELVDSDGDTSSSAILPLWLIQRKFADRRGAVDHHPMCALTRNGWIGLLG